MLRRRETYGADPIAMIRLYRRILDEDARDAVNAIVETTAAGVGAQRQNHRWLALALGIAVAGAGAAVCGGGIAGAAPRRQNCTATTGWP